MTDDRRMTTDRFYGGVSNRLQNLRSMLEYVDDQTPTRDELNRWVIENTPAGSSDAVSHHLAFLESIRLIEPSDTGCELAEYGQEWLQDQNSETLFEALSSGVKGFEILLHALQDGPMTDEEIMDLLVSEFDEAEMSKPGPAVRHREWLQALGFVERDDGISRLTSEGRNLSETVEKSTASTSSSMHSSPEGVSVGNRLSKDRIEEVFDTGFGYRISGINPRRDEDDRRYVLVFANEDGPYNDSVTQGRFKYIGEGLSGDQSEDSPGNSVLIDACTSDIPVHFFYKREDDKEWEYQGLIDVVDYEFRKQGGRDVLVFTMEHRQAEQSDTSKDQQPTEDDVAQAKTALSETVESEPQLTEDQERYTQSRRRARDSAFTQLVRETYDEQCAICGSERESPDGKPEVEAAHIYPKYEGGRDDVRNGIALCKLHHWAFDTGWLSLSDDHEILVKEASEREGYHEFKRLEGDLIHLPEQEDAKPHPLFLKEHRQLHGFNDD